MREFDDDDDDDEAADDVDACDEVVAFTSGLFKVSLSFFIANKSAGGGAFSFLVSLT